MHKVKTEAAMKVTKAADPAQRIGAADRRLNVADVKTEKDDAVNAAESGELSLLTFSHPHWFGYYMKSEDGARALLFSLGVIVAVPFLLFSAIYSGWFTAVLGLICLAVGGGPTYGAALLLTWLIWLPGDQTTQFYDILPFMEGLVLFVSLPLTWKAGIIGAVWYFNKNPIR